MCDDKERMDCKKNSSIYMYICKKKTGIEPIQNEARESHTEFVIHGTYADTGCYGKILLFLKLFCLYNTGLT